MPAHLDRAARTTRLVLEAPGPAPAGSEEILERVLENLIEAVGEPANLRPGPEDEIPYCLDYLNPDADLSELMVRLAKGPHARICLYGPPGTGKSAFGKHLAQKLGMPLRLYRASDLLDSLVGGTEANIARMFREAEREGALLLVDEADSFLRDRSRAFHSWEVTQVNEFLVGMENYNGLFVASTNLVTGLDPAVYRRFDCKIRFEALTPPQRFALCNAVLAKWNQPALGTTDPEAVRLKGLVGLTPGDFRAAVRKLHLVCQTGAATLIAALKGELSYRPDVDKPGIGFLAS